MPKFIITGKKRLQGRVKPAGNKNAALPMLAACLLTDEELVLEQVPDILDVRVMLEILSNLGVEVAFQSNQARLRAHSLHSYQLDEHLCAKVRSSILCAGPLAARHGRARFFPPGGDIIGHRRLDTHFLGLEKLGFSVEGKGPFSVIRKKIRGASIILDEASVTGTENIMMAATLAPGKTEIYHAACEPHVQDLGRLLVAMGARIEGLGTNRLIIHGVKSLGGATHRVAEDYVEIGSYLAAAAATRGSIEIGPIHNSSPLRVLERPFHRLGVDWIFQRKTLRYEYKGPLRIRQDVQGSIPKIEDGIWPAFPSDLMSVAIVLASQSRGSLLFFEKLFESRMYFVDQLIGMGSQIVQCDPHRVLVNGPSSLQGRLISSPDIRAGMALIIAALCAKGTTTIENVQMIDRGYEQLDTKLNQLNALVERVV